MDIGIAKQIKEARNQIKEALKKLPKNAVPGAFQDAIDVVYPKDGPKPLIIQKRPLVINGQPYREVKKSRKDSIKDSVSFARKFFSKAELAPNRDETWFFVVNIPPGRKYSEFKSHEQLFADAVKGSCYIEKRGRAVHVWLSNVQLDTFLPYCFDPTQYKDYYLPVNFGISSRGPIIRDIADTHWFFAGETRYGKSNLIHCTIYGVMLASAKNEYKAFVCIIDLKRIEFPEFDEWAWRVTDIAGARFMLTKILEEINRREELFAKARVRKIQDYLYKGFSLPFVFLVIDELHKLQDTLSQQMLQTILAIGAGFGIIVLCSTQRPSSTIFDKVKFGDLKANFDGKVSLRASTESDSRIILDDPLAAYLPNIKGRAIFQWDVEVEIQTPYFPLHPKEEPQLQALLSELGEPRFPVRSEPHEKHVTPQKGILPGPKSNLLAGRTDLLNNGSASIFDLF